jgi:hypothetical protein
MMEILETQERQTVMTVTKNILQTSRSGVGGNNIITTTIQQQQQQVHTLNHERLKFTSTTIPCSNENCSYFLNQVYL